MIRIVPCFLLLMLFSGGAHAQDTLPKFSLKNVGNNRIIIGWTNRFEDIRQVSIQRSFDSLKNFRTILTVPDPSTPQNGYVDTKAPNDHMFYRLYIMLDKGIYLFSDSKRPKLDTVVATAAISNRPDVQQLPAGADPANPDLLPPGADPSMITIMRPGRNGTSNVLIPADSIRNPVINNMNRPKADLFVPSRYVYMYPDGYVKITLPEKPGKYSIKFFTMDDKPLFELKDLKTHEFRIDKTNFYRSGWFKFELYNDGDLVEKHRFYLPREF